MQYVVAIITAIPGWVVGLVKSSTAQPIILSSAAILISLAALGHTICTRRKFLKIAQSQEDDRLKDKTKARLIAQFTFEQGECGRREGRLMISNDGAAGAHDVTTIIDGKEISQQTALDDDTKEVRHVAPGCHFQYLVTDPSVLENPCDIKLSWSDDSSEQGTCHTQFTRF
jgi:hypothetical protein